MRSLIECSQQIVPKMFANETNNSVYIADVKVLARWRNAAYRAVRHFADPWKRFKLHEMPVMRARRFRYSATRKTWVEDIVEVEYCFLY